MIEFIIGAALGAIFVLFLKKDEYEQGYRDALVNVLENLVLLRGKQE